MGTETLIPGSMTVCVQGGVHDIKSVMFCLKNCFSFTCQKIRVIKGAKGLIMMPFLLPLFLSQDRKEGLRKMFEWMNIWYLDLSTIQCLKMKYICYGYLTIDKILLPEININLSINTQLSKRYPKNILMPQLLLYCHHSCLSNLLCCVFLSLARVWNEL